MVRFRTHRNVRIWRQLDASPLGSCRSPCRSRVVVLSRLGRRRARLSRAALTTEREHRLLPVMSIHRLPCRALRPFIRTVWAREAATEPLCPVEEMILPTGSAHLVFRLGGSPATIQGRLAPDITGTAFLAGARLSPYRKRSAPSASVGAELSPGCPDPVSGVPASGLAGRHWRLEELWPQGAARAIQRRLEAADSGSARLDILERFLLGFFVQTTPPAEGLDIEALAAGIPIAAVAEGLGISRRHLVRRFQARIGMPPKTFARLARVNRALETAFAEPAVSWAEIAASHGYVDQAHLANEFRALVGRTAGQWRAAAHGHGRHMRLSPADVPFLQDAAGGKGHDEGPFPGGLHARS